LSARLRAARRAPAGATVWALAAALSIGASLPRRHRRRRSGAAAASAGRLAAVGATLSPPPRCLYEWGTMSIACEAVRRGGAARRWRRTKWRLLNLL